MVLQYAALGSSFAAGPGISPIVDLGAMRSGRNYPHLLAALIGAELTDLTVSGATTATILDEPQVTMTGGSFPPQLCGVPAEADLVTVTAGGNDLRYATSLLYRAWQLSAPDDALTALLAADFAQSTAGSIESAAAGLTAVVDRVRAAAPKARVLLVDYLSIFGDDTVPGPGIPFGPGDLDGFRIQQAGLERAYRMAAERSGAELVTVSELSRDHALGAKEPWIAPFHPDPRRTHMSFHPNAAGMAAVAAHLAELLDSSTPGPGGR